MPFPVGHAAIGAVTLNIVSKEKSLKSWFLLFLVIVVLGNLPDIDVLIGLLFKDEGALFHRGPTHSIVFSLGMGYLSSQVLRYFTSVPKISTLECASIILSHVVADWLLTSSGVSLLWPLEVNFSEGCKSWSAVFDSVVFEAHKDVGIIAFSSAVLLFKYSFRRVRFFSKFVKELNN